MLCLEGQKTNSELANGSQCQPGCCYQGSKNLGQRGHGGWVRKTRRMGSVTYFSALTKEAQPIAQEHKEHHQETLGVYRSVLDQFDHQERQVIGRFLIKLAEKIEE